MTSRCASVVGNLLVIAVALRHKTRNTTSVLIVGLAVADSSAPPNPRLPSHQHHPTGLPFPMCNGGRGRAVLSSVIDREQFFQR